MSDTLEKIFLDVKKKVDTSLVAYLQTKEKTLLQQEILRFIQNGGKRIRPALFLQAYEACGGEHTEQTLAIAAALELFHTFGLIHDDIIDRALLRRGERTIHERIGVSQAILAGDLALIWANELFYQNVQTIASAKNINSAMRHWRHMQEEVMLGESLDVSLHLVDVLQNKTRNANKLEKKVLEIMEYKTARYSFMRPLLLAAVCADGPKEMYDALSRYGYDVGMAFQLTDDILGMFGDVKVLGKPVDSDVKEGKVTLLTLKLLEHLDKQEITRAHFQNRVWLQHTIQDLGVLQDCKKRVVEYINKAKQSINTARIQKKDKTFFLEFADHLAQRNY